MVADTSIERIVRYAEKVLQIDPSLIRWGLRFRQIHRHLERLFDKQLESFGLSARKVEILEVLYHHPDRSMTPAALADEVILTRGAMTSNLDGLERIGYIRRLPHLTDRRMISVELTPKGVKYMEETLARRYRVMAEAVSCMTDREHEQMFDYYQRATQSLETLLAEDSECPQ